MELNKKNKRLVQSLVKAYCKKMKIGIPLLTVEIIFPRKLSKYDHWGKYIFADDLLYINLEIHNSEDNLRNTIAHELTHKLKPKLKHGDKFDKIVDHYFSR